MEKKPFQKVQPLGEEKKPFQKGKLLEEIRKREEEEQREEKILFMALEEAWQQREEENLFTGREAKRDPLEVLDDLGRYFNLPREEAGQGDG